MMRFIGSDTRTMTTPATVIRPFCMMRCTHRVTSPACCFSSPCSRSLMEDCKTCFFLAIFRAFAARYSASICSWLGMSVWMRQASTSSSCRSTEICEVALPHGEPILGNSMDIGSQKTVQGFLELWVRGDGDEITVGVCVHGRDS